VRVIVTEQKGTKNKIQLTVCATW